MKLAIILGTRPEIIKLSPIIKYCEKNNLGYFIIHTNQHYSYELDKVFFEELELPKAKYNLNIGSHSHGKQVSLMLEKIETILLKENPNFVFVQGDTNTVLAGSLAASKIKNIKLIHIEAGLRSYDKTMPEEINRIISDHISDLLFTPTLNNKKILINERINENKIFNVGNTIVDALNDFVNIAKEKSNILQKFNIKPKNYLILTLHRPSNVDNKEGLGKIFLNLSKLNENIIFPVHPRTLNNINSFKIKIQRNTKLIKPLGHLDFLHLLNNSKLILTDSGGIQEEACILKIPCITIRENTERPETIEVGSNILSKPEDLLEKYNFMSKKNTNWENPYGNNVTEKIFEILLKDINEDI